MRILTVFAIFALSGCAYHWGQHKRSIPGGYDQVSVPIFVNRTKESGIESFFTASIINEFERSGLARVKSKGDSQIVLEGRVEQIDYVDGTKVDKDDPGYEELPSGVVLTKEYRVIAKVFVQLRRRSDQKVVWSGEFDGERRYSAPQVTVEGSNTVNPLYNHVARRSTLKVLAKDLMAEAFDRITENF